MKAFLNNTYVHVTIIGAFALLTQWLTSSGYESVTVGVIVHAIYEKYLGF